MYWNFHDKKEIRSEAVCLSFVIRQVIENKKVDEFMLTMFQKNKIQQDVFHTPYIYIFKRPFPHPVLHNIYFYSIYKWAVTSEVTDGDPTHVRHVLAGGWR